MPAILFCKKSQINPKKSQRVRHKIDHTHLNVVYCYEDSFMYCVGGHSSSGSISRSCSSMKECM